jgi:phosphoribosylaminoimidazolecarboxamide formyltransferase/IMP cyclohydrolase
MLQQQWNKQIVLVIAPEYDAETIEILQQKKKTIILIQNEVDLPQKQVRSCLNGLLIQERNNITDNKEDLKTVTVTSPTEQEIQDLIFASKVCKNTKHDRFAKTEH